MDHDDGAHLAARGKNVCIQNAPNPAPVRCCSDMTRAIEMTSSVFLHLTLALCICSSPAWAANLSVFKGQRSERLTVVYPKGYTEENMPMCEKWAVCNRVDTYASPWIERRCSCRNGLRCSTALHIDDGHTLPDKSHQYKVCEEVDTLPTCRFFRNVTWTYVTDRANRTKQLVHCRCPPKSTTYISGHEFQKGPNGSVIYKYYFSCSPLSVGHVCRRKEPCRLFTVSKRLSVEEVTTDTICQCPSKMSCPRHHLDSNIVISDYKSNNDAAKVYSGYCGVDLASSNES